VPRPTTIPSNTVIFQYDEKGNPVFKQDSLGKTDIFTYNAQDRQLGHIQKKSDNAEKISTTVKYDLNGNSCVEKEIVHKDVLKQFRDRGKIG